MNKEYERYNKSRFIRKLNSLQKKKDNSYELSFYIIVLKIVYSAAFEAE